MTARDCPLASVIRSMIGFFTSVSQPLVGKMALGGCALVRLVPEYFVGGAVSAHRVGVPGRRTSK